MIRATLTGLLLLLAATAVRGATVDVRDDDQLRRALARARPGTTIRVAPGRYRGGIAARLRGEPKRPIVVTAADRKKPPVIEGGNVGLTSRRPSTPCSSRWFPRSSGARASPR